MNKGAQEEMIGFALIVVLISVILLVFISISLNNSETKEIESYKVESFLQALLSYTTSCEKNFGNLEIDELIRSCSKQEFCENGKESCRVLEETLEEILSKSWKIENSPIQSYNFTIKNFGKESLQISGGSSGTFCKGALTSLDSNIHIYLKVCEN